MHDKDKQNQFVELRAKGLSYSRISEEIGVSKPTLIEWARQLNLEIANLKAIELEGLNERYFLTRKGKIEAFGEVISALKEEIKGRLDKRELQILSVKELLELLIKTHSYLKDEAISPVFHSSETVSCFDDSLTKTQILSWSA